MIPLSAKQISLDSPFKYEVDMLLLSLRIPYVLWCDPYHRYFPSCSHRYFYETDLDLLYQRLVRLSFQLAAGVHAGLPDPSEGDPRRGPSHVRHRGPLPGRGQFRVPQGTPLRRRERWASRMRPSIWHPDPI
jgi:hypothetical protein